MSQVTGTCPSCTQPVEPGMAFCMYCGQVLASLPAAKADAELPDGRTCPACGRTDNLNTRFCIFCGASVAATGELAAGTAFKRKTTGTIEIDLAPLMEARFTVVAAVAGAVTGIILMLFVMRPVVEQVVAKLGWPRAGLVVYAVPPRAQIAIQDAEGRHFTLGRSGPEGELTVPDLPPGAYKLTVAAPGYQTVTRDVQIETSKVAIIGFPHRLELPRIGAER